MKDRFAIAHMKVAHIYAELSHCARRQVGCVIVKNNSIISVGYNGMPVGYTNDCENEQGETYPSVIHAEDNALRKLTRSHESADGASMFITIAPCNLCTPRIIDAGIKRVYYDNIHRHAKSIHELEQNGIEVIHIPIK